MQAASRLLLPRCDWKGQVVRLFIGLLCDYYYFFEDLLLNCYAL